MAQYVIYVYVKDFEGKQVTNEFYVNGTEAAWNMYKMLRDNTDCIGIQLVYCDTGEIIEEEPNEEEDYFDEDFEDWYDEFFDTEYPEDYEDFCDDDCMPCPEDIDPDFLAYIEGCGFGIWLL